MECPNNSQTLDAEGFWPFLCRAQEETNVSRGTLGFCLFLLATATLLLRPADLFPALQNVPIYQTIIIACLAISIPRISYHLSPFSPAVAITHLILGVCISIILSQLYRGSIYDARVGGFEFFKLFIYYLLILSWVDSPARLRQFMLFLCAACLALTILALLDYDRWIDLPALRSVDQIDTDPNSGAVSILRRLCSTGIFSDPNDLCLLLDAAAVLCFSFTGSGRWGRLRYGWFIPMGLFFYAVRLTSSRGGLIALLGATGAIFVARYGKARATLAGAIMLPIMLAVFAGRQTHVDLSNPEDTFQARLDHWSDSLTLFKQSPIFGIGQEQQVALLGQVAHNSFIQSFAELGLAGGACFLGLFLLSVTGIYRASPETGDAELARLRPYIFGIVGGYGIGLLALSRAYTPSTYLILGIGACYINLTSRRQPLRLSGLFLQQLLGLCLLFIAGTYAAIRVLST